ncbi:MAG: hypothetical protein Q8L48_19245 [Archangium sp.]|nr:hypothetical protein [Archangium sp.]
MLVAGAVAVGLLLGGHLEAPREVKFAGALLAQAGVAPPQVNEEARNRELAELIRDRPSLTPSAVVLGISGGLTVVTLAVVMIGAGIARWGSLTAILVGFMIGFPAFIVGMVGGIMMIVAGVMLHSTDERIRELKAAGPPVVLRF